MAPLRARTGRDKPPAGVNDATKGLARARIGPPPGRRVTRRKNFAGAPHDDRVVPGARNGNAAAEFTFHRGARPRAAVGRGQRDTVVADHHKGAGHHPGTVECGGHTRSRARPRRAIGRAEDHAARAGRDKGPIGEALLNTDLQGAKDLDDYARRLASVPLAYHPGEKWIYSNSIDVVGLIVQQVSGKPFGEFLSERLFDPLGMTDTGFPLTPEQRPRVVGECLRRETLRRRPLPQRRPALRQRPLR